MKKSAKKSVVGLEHVVKDLAGCAKKNANSCSKYCKNTKSKTAVVDTFGSITYSILTGVPLDCSAGLSAYGVIVSRTSATGINAVTGGAYGWWREAIFNVTKTNKESRRVRKTAADLFAFNTFQVPIYATGIAIGSFVSEGTVDWDKVIDGVTYLATISPVIGPTMGWYMNWFRGLFGIKKAEEGTYGKKDLENID